MALENFPHAADGDVAIRLSVTETLVLHSSVLRQHSRFFRTGFSARWNRDPVGQTSIDRSHGSCYELKFDKGTTFGTLVQVESTKPDTSSSTELAVEWHDWREVLIYDIQMAETDAWSYDLLKETKETDLLRERTAIIKAHRNLFGAMYGDHSGLSTCTFPFAMDAIKYLTRAAAMYFCEDTVKPCIHSCLSYHEGEVLEYFQEKPLDMLALAVDAKSTWLYKEAAVFLISADGEYFDGECYARLDELCPSGVLEAKREVFLSTLKAHDSKLAQLTAARDLVMNYQKRAANLADAFFRDWLATETTFNWKPYLREGYPWMYRMLARGRSAYTKSERYGLVKSYLKKLGSNDTQSVNTTDKYVRELFDQASHVIAPLLERTVKKQANPDSLVEPLAFMEIANDELPWVVDEDSDGLEMK